jgi:hypothetical protein
MHAARGAAAHRFPRGGNYVIQRSAVILSIWALTLALPAEVRAQGEPPLADMLVDLLTQDIRLAPPPAGFVSHEAHFVSVGGQTFAPTAFNQALVTQLATVPIGSPSGGFSFTFDRLTGTFQRATETFGASFADRALTNGAGKVTLGLNHQYSKYTKFESESLDNGDVTFYLRHTDSGGLFFEGDLIQADLRLDLANTTTTVFVNYGVTDRFDLAVAVPYVRVRMDADVNATILRIATGASSNLHAFPGGGTTQTYSRSGFASGIGDVQVRTKFRVLDTTGGGLAAGVNVRLPTGDADNLLGTGAAAVTGTLIASSSMGRFSPHANVDFTGSAKGDIIDVPNELGYRFGGEFAVSPKVTISADGVGRSLFDASRLALGDTQWNYTDLNGVARSTTLNEYSARVATLNLLSAAIGTKINVAGNLLITGNVLFALSSGGVTAPVTPVVGFEYSF